MGRRLCAEDQRKLLIAKKAAARERQLAEYTKQQQSAGFRPAGAAPAPAPNPAALSADEQQARRPGG